VIVGKRAIKVQFGVAFQRDREPKIKISDLDSNKVLRFQRLMDHM
jgi:hypothetical protein